jgi:hypothetical protein
MLIRLLALIMFVGQIQLFAAEGNRVETMEGPVLILQVSETKDLDQQSYGFITRLEDGSRSIYSRVVVYRDREKFDQEMKKQTQYSEPTVSRDDHKVWENTSERNVSKTIHIFSSPFNRGGGSPQSVSRTGSLNEFEKLAGTRINGLMLDDSLTLLNRLLKADSSLKLLSVRHEETKLGEYTSEDQFYYLAR